jgi:transcriptional regulator of arginine metabolism
MIVIRTLPGCANVVGEFIDTLNSKDIIGTLAGDNTLLVIPVSQKKTAHVIKFLKEQLIEGHQ